MSHAARYQFRIATPEDDAGIHRLNYLTFVEEIPQHDPNPAGLLVDRFHDENIYLICRDGPDLAGMITLRTTHPFSLEEKLGDLTTFLPVGSVWCELRLLAVPPQWRGTAVTAGLLQFAAEELVRRGCSGGIVSATTRQRKLYAHLGFTPFARPVGREGAWYQPMYLRVSDFKTRAAFLPGSDRPTRRTTVPVNLLPGPVTVCEEVRRTTLTDSVSHRGEAFLAAAADVRRRLCALTGMSHASLFSGSGTLANDAIAAQISLTGTPGLILSGGEFGERLIDHARRWRLDFTALHSTPDGPPDPTAIRETLAARPDIRWIWTTHCETSTGALTDLPALLEIARAADVRICLDSVSTLGLLSLDLRGVWMASGTSGKGLAALAGVAIVLHEDRPAPQPDRIPRYLDLGLYQDEAPPFTQNSGLLFALHAALQHTDWNEKHCRIRGTGDELRRRLAEAGISVLGRPGHPAWSPAVLTLPLPPHVDSAVFARQMESEGWLLSAHSGYLVKQNRVQICLMGCLHPGDTHSLPETLGRMLLREC